MFFSTLRTLRQSTKIILLMGVAGSGKSTVGQMLAAALNWPYFEADDFHSPGNKDKMRRGLPLDDEDRAPWLNAIRAKIEECRASGRSAVFSCSALKEKYRSVLGLDAPDTILVHLTGDIKTIMERIGQREGHYLKADLVQSQFDALESPRSALSVDIKLTPEAIIQTILKKIETST